MPDYSGVRIGGLTLEQLRDEFPVSREWIFLDHASISSLPLRAVEAMNGWNEGRSAEAHTDVLRVETWESIVDRTREKMARFMGALAEEIAFTTSTGHGVSIVANGLGLEAGDRVIINTLEHPTNIGPWMELARRDGIVIDVVRAHDDGCLYVEDFEAAMTPRTRVVALGSVCSFNGFRMQLEELGQLCRRRGVYLLVDAIQELGAMRVDVKASGAHFLSGAIYKWLLGPYGHGYLYVSKDVMQDVEPTQIWYGNVKPGGRDWDSFIYPHLLSMEGNPTLSYAEGARRFEAGGLDWGALLGLEACLDLFFELGPENVEKRILSLGDFLIEGFDRMGVVVNSPRAPGTRSGIVSIVADDPDAMVAYCEERKIRIAPRGGGVRIAPHVYNTEEEMARVLETVEAYRKGQ